MNKIAFIGSYDKTDMLLYMAKTLTILKKRVIVIDTTTLQKSRYIVPTMKPTRKYITTFQSVDVAIGFESFEDIKEYQRQTGESSEYDYALLDIDSIRGYAGFKVQPTDKHYFVTSFDTYSLKRGLQIFKHLTTPIEVRKILFTKEMASEEDQYLNYMSSKLKIKWNKDIIYFPFETSDFNAIYANQRSGRIRIRGLSVPYMDSLMFIIEDFTEIKQGLVKKAVKVLEKN